MGSSTSLGLSPPDVIVKEGAKSAPNTNPHPKDKSGWYYSELEGDSTRRGSYWKEKRVIEQKKKENLVRLPSPLHPARRYLLHKLLKSVHKLVRPCKRVLPRLGHKWEKSQRSTKCTRIYLPLVQNPARQTHPILSSIWSPRQPSPHRLQDLRFSLHPLFQWLLPLPMLGMVAAPWNFRNYRLNHMLRPASGLCNNALEAQGASMIFWE